MRRVYVSGPITGYPNLNEHAFREAAGLLCARGDDPLIPHDMQPHSHAGKCPEVYGDRTVGDHDGGCYLRADLVAMLEQADVVYRLRGWSQSRGARVECALASLLGIPIEDAPDVEPTLESDLADGWDAWWREVDEVADRFERGRR